MTSKTLYEVTVGKQSKIVKGEYFSDENGFHRDDRYLLAIMYATTIKTVTFEEGQFDDKGIWRVTKKTKVTRLPINAEMSAYDIDFIHFSYDGQPHRARFGKDYKVIHCTCTSLVIPELNRWMDDHKELVIRAQKTNKAKLDSW